MLRRTPIQKRSREWQLLVPWLVPEVVADELEQDDGE